MKNISAEVEFYLQLASVPSTANHLISLLDWYLLVVLPSANISVLAHEIQNFHFRRKLHSLLTNYLEARNCKQFSIFLSILLIQMQT